MKVEAPSYEEGVGVLGQAKRAELERMEDCRGTLHKSRPSLGTLNLRAEESKDIGGTFVRK